MHKYTCIPKQLSLVLLFGMLSIAMNAQDCSPVGSWQNEQGSVLQIDSIDKGNRIYGVYKSSSGVDGRSFPLQGWYNKFGAPAQALSFSVHWGEYGSITSWTGYIEMREEQCQIYTLWHLIRPNTDFVWERIIVNSSTFSPVE